MLRRVAKFFKPKKFLALALMLLVIFVVPAHFALASDITDAVLSVIGSIIVALILALGQLILIVINVLVEVAQYNGFITMPAVVLGWGIVRDLSNMFFILILLIIAFATILHIRDYSIKQLLKRVIIFAILINFSKMICGVLIDFVQVIMLTFVNGFKGVGGNNFVFLLGMDKLFSMSATDWENLRQQQGSYDFWGVVASYIVALLYVIVMLVVMFALLITLVYRVVMLWILIILSPLSYLGSVAPLTRGVTTNWWKQFSNNLIVGPILAFFIWLSLATLGQFNSASSLLNGVGFNTPSGGPRVGLTDVGTTEHLMRFAVSIGLLLGGLIVAKSFGGVAGATAGTAMARLQSGAGWAKRKSLGLAKRGAVGATKATGRAAWKGTKAVGRGGLGLAKAVDYRASRNLVKAFGREYGDRPGFVTRGAGAVYNNLMTKQGLKDNFNKLTKNKFNRAVTQQRLAATVTGAHKEGDVMYKYDKNRNDGTMVSDTGAVSKLKAYVPGSFGYKFAQAMHASKFGTAKDVAQTERANKEYEELMSPYKNMSSEELHSLLGGTTDKSKLKGIYAALAAKGEFKNLESTTAKESFNKAQELFANNPAQLKALRSATQEKQAELLFDLTNADQKAALKKLIEKNKIDFDKQNLSTFDLNSQTNLRGQVGVEADRRNLANFTEAFREALKKERWSSALSKKDKDGDPKQAGQLSEALGELAHREEEKLLNAKNQLDLAKVAQQDHPDEANQQVIDHYTDEIKKAQGNLTYLRADSLNLDLNGDATKAFTGLDGKLDVADLEKYATKASAKQLGNINSDKLSPEALKVIAESTSADRLKTLERSGNNPDLARMIAVEKTKNFDPESPKIINIYNDLDADLSKARDNEMIKNVLREAGVSGSGKLGQANDLSKETLNGLRNLAQKEQGAGPLNKDAIETYLKLEKII